MHMVDSHKKSSQYRENIFKNVVGGMLFFIIFVKKSDRVAMIFGPLITIIVMHVQFTTICK